MFDNIDFWVYYEIKNAFFHVGGFIPKKSHFPVNGNGTHKQLLIATVKPWGNGVKMKTIKIDLTNVNLLNVMEYVKKRIQRETMENIDEIINDASNIFVDNYDDYCELSNYLTLLLK